MEIRSGAVNSIDELSEGWELVKSQFGSFFAMTIIVIAITIGVSFAMSLVNNVITAVLTAIIGGVGANHDSQSINSGFFIVQGSSLLTGSLLGIVTNVVSFCLYCGFFMATARVRTDGFVQVGDVFKGFSRWKPCLVYSLIATVAQFAAMIVFGGAAVGLIASTIGLEALKSPDRMMRNPDILTPAVGGFIVVGLVLFVVSILWSILQMMILPLIARGEDFSSAFFGSIKAGLSNFFGLLAFSIISGLLMFLGVLACLLGVLFVIPIVYVALFVVSEKIFGPVAIEGRNDPPSPDQFGFSGGFSQGQ